ncbi:MAG: copper resistance protein NlpE N-terminal domain-containing protein [Bacteroidia bacterium]
MKNPILIIAVLILFHVSCVEPNPSKDEIKESQQNMKQTEEALARFPAVYEGTVGIAGYDSVRLSFSLNSNQEYTLTKEFYNSGKKDTTDYEKGKWLMEGENIISAVSSDKIRGFEKFKIISKSQLRLLDSLGNELGNDKNNDLMMISEPNYQ